MKTLTDEALAVALPTAFPELFLDAWKHDGLSLINQTRNCTKCGLPMECCRKATPQSHQPCTVPTPITIDWNVAMMVVRECKPEYIWNALYKAKLFSEMDDVLFEIWLLFHATPADYLRAALLAKGAE